MKKLLIALGVGVVLLAIAVVVGPSFVDWNRYKGQVIDAVQKATGRTLAIDGDISLALLPSPRFTVSGLRLANPQGANSPEMLRVKSVNARIAFQPLFRRQLRIESLTLDEPTLRLERLPDGSGNWRGLAPPSWMQLDYLRLHNATVSYRDDRSGFGDTLTDVDAAIAANSAAGPFLVRGRASLHGVAADFEATLERAGGSQPAQLGLALSSGPNQLAFSGTVVDGEKGLALSGRLHLSGQNLEEAATSFGLPQLGQLPIRSAKGYALDAGIDADESGRLAFSGLDLHLGDGEIKGSVGISAGQPPHLDLALRVDKIDLDKKTPGTKAQSAAPAGEAEPATPQATLAAVFFALPPTLDATLDLAVDRIVYGGELLQQVVLKGNLAKGQLDLSQLSASLPGGTDVTLAGVLGAASGQPSFTGTVHAASANLRELLGWLKLDLPAIPSERLRKAILSADLTLAPTEFDLRNLDANIDSTRLKGGATVLLRARPAFGASLAIDRLNLDGYLPQAPAAAAPEESKTGPPPPPEPGKPRTGANAELQSVLDRLKNFDANFRGRIDHLIYRGEEITGLRLDGTVQDGALTLHEAGVDNLAGVQGKLSGSLKESQGEPQIDVTLDAAAAELAPFMHFARIESSVDAERLGGLALKGQVKGALDKLGVDVGGIALGGNYKAVGTIGFTDGLRYDLDVTMLQPRLASLLGLIIPVPLPPDLGSMSLSGHFKGEPGALAVTGLKTQSGLVDAVGDLDLSGFPQAPVVKADLALTLRRLGLLVSLAKPGQEDNAMLDRLGAVTARVKADGDTHGFTLDSNVAAQGGKLELTGRFGSAEQGTAYDLRLKGDDADLTPLVASLLPGRSVKDLGPLQLEARLAGGLENLSLSELSLHSGLMDASGNVDLRDLVQKPSVTAAIDVDAKRLPLLFALAGVVPQGALSRLQEFGVKGKIEGPFVGLSVDLALKGNETMATVKGKAGLTDAGPTYALAVTANDADFGAVLHLLAPDYRPAGKALGPFQLQLNAAGHADAVTLSDLQAKLGSFDVTGNIDASFGGARPRLVIRLDAGAIDLGPLLPAKTAAIDPLLSRPRGQAAMAASEHWSTAPIDFALLRGADADLALSSQAVSYRAYRLEAAKLAATLNDGVLSIASLTGKISDGELTLSGLIDAKASPGVSLAFKLDQAKLDQDGLRLGPLALANGSVDIAGDFKASGGSEFAMAHSLSGAAAVSLTDATIEGLDIPAIDEQLAKQDGNGDVLALLKELTSGGTTKLPHAAGSFVARDGVIENRDFKLEADGATGQGEGTFDLPRWYMDYGVAFRLTAPGNVPPFSIRLRGGLDDPRKFLFANEIQEYLLRRGMNAILKDIHKGTQPSPNGDAGAQQKKSPTQMLNDILKSLQHPKEPPQEPPSPSEQQ